MADAIRMINIFNIQSYSHEFTHVISGMALNEGCQTWP